MNPQQQRTLSATQSPSSSTSASTPSTVIHISHPASSVVTTNPDPTAAPIKASNSVATKDFLRAENNRVLPTSNFLINRHKLLRKTEEGKVLHEGGTLTGAKHLGSSNSNAATTLVTQNIQRKPTDLATDKTAAAREEIKSTGISTASVKINQKPTDEYTETDHRDQPQELQQLDKEPLDRNSAASRQISSVRWLPTNLRPQIPQKPAVIDSHTSSTTVETNNKPSPEELELTKRKHGRGILRVPSLKGSLSRSRTPSRGPSEERVPKKSQEFLEETVMYTKPMKTEPPLSGNRHHLLRGKLQQPVVASGSRVVVSPPQFMNTTTNQVGTSIQIGSTRAPSPSPQRTTIIPTPVQSQPVKVRNIAVTPPVPTAVTAPATPVYSRLSEARTMVKSTHSETVRSSAAPSPSASLRITAQIRPTPPRKPVRTEITDSLLEMLPQQKGKRQAPLPPPPAEQRRNPYAAVSYQERETVVRTERHADVPNHNGVTIHVNQTGNNGTRDFTPNLRSEVSTHRREEQVKSPSFSTGQMTFDDEFESAMSSSHVDYEHSSADETDDLVKRSLVKASNRRAPIEDIEEENTTTTVVETVQTSSTPGKLSNNNKPEYDRLPQRPVRVVARKPSFLSSADDSDSSRGGRGTFMRSSETVTKVSRNETKSAEEAIDSDGQQLSREDSAGRRKYAERRQLLRNFEDGLQRKRLNSSKTSSSVDSDTVDREDNFIHRNNDTKGQMQTAYGYRKAKNEGQKSIHSSTFADHESDDSIGVPDPLPEYEYPNRIQGRTIKEVQEIRETVRLRSNSSSSSSSGEHSPSRKAQKRDHHFSRHFDISPEELTTARSLIHHRLPPNYNEPPNPVVGSHGSSSRMNVTEQNRTPPPVRQMQQLSRPQSQSPDGRRQLQRPPHLPPPGPSPVHMGPVVHHSDGETRYYPEKPKKKIGIVRRLSELVRGERKYKRPAEPGRIRNSSQSSIEEQQEHQPTGALTARRQSPVRRYQDQPLRSLPPAATTVTNNQHVSRVDRGPSFTKPTGQNVSNRYSGDFSDSPTGTASFTYQEQVAPVYAQPNKLQKQQNLRYRSMSEYDLNQIPEPVRPVWNPQVHYDGPVKSSKSIESLSEVVSKRKGTKGNFIISEPEQYSERTIKTPLIPWGKSGDMRNVGVQNAAYSRGGFYDKNASHYSSTPILSTPGRVDYRMAPPAKPPRRHEFDAANRAATSDLTYNEPVRMEPRTLNELHLQRARQEEDSRSATYRAGHYSEPIEIHRRTTAPSTTSEDETPPRERFKSRVTDTKKYIEAVVPEMHARPQLEQGTVIPTKESQVPAYARTRIAANDYTNRRYHSAAAEINRAPVEPPTRRYITRDGPSDQAGDRQYKSSYRIQMGNPSPYSSASVVQERSRFFNNLPVRREVDVRR